MIEFNEIRVDVDKDILILSAQIKDDQNYEDVYLDSIIIDTQNTYTENGPSTKPIYKKKISEYFEEQSLILGRRTASRIDKYKHFDIEISSKELEVDISKTLFFVYVTAQGTPSPGTPCGEDNKTVLGVAYCLKPIYDKYLSYLKKFTACCTTNKHLIDFDIKYRAFRLFLKTHNFIQAIKYYKQFVLNNTGYTIQNTCNCK